jgi:adenine deaminase
MEVQDAIPYNGAIMHDVGIVVSFNSDSDELARRLNYEAAKAVRYGGITPEEALKFVTINPAKQLKIDHRMGSLEKGKDADFVIWSGDPLSTYTKCEQTWVDGACLFSLEKDKQLREYTQAERTRIIQKILKQSLGEPQKDKPQASQTQPDAKRDEPKPEESKPEREPGECDED